MKEDSSIIGGVRVIYSRLGENADSVIKRIITKEKGLWIVVTKDRDIIRYAWSTGSVPISSEDFLNAVTRSQIEEEVSHDEFEDDYIRPERKGNPRKLSKKERAIRHILNKL